MSRYLDRPVFEFVVDWSDQPGARIDADLRTLDNGLGVPISYTDRTWPAWGWEFEVNLDTAADLQAWTIFFNAGIAGRMGHMRAWWLPVPHCPFVIVARPSSSTLIVTGDELVAVWDRFPEFHVRLEKTGETAIHAEVTDLTDNEDGTVTLTFDGTPVGSVDSSWRSFRLALVRQATGEEAMTYESEQRAIASVRVIEVTLEYATANEGQRVVWLYKFEISANGTETWRVTNLPYNITGPGGIYYAAKITHENLHRSADGSRDSVTISAEFEEGIDPINAQTPLTLLFPRAVSGLITVTISVLVFRQPLRTLFVGRLGAPEVDGKRVRCMAAAALDLTGAYCPNLLLQRRCNYQVFSAPCGLTRVDFEEIVTFAAGATDYEVVITGGGLTGLEYGYFAEGVFRTGTADERQVRLVTKSTAEVGSGTVTLTLDRPLSAVSSNAALVTPGCNGRSTTCSGKFDNFVNFGGHRYSHDNLTVRALPAPKLSGGKK